MHRETGVGKFLNPSIRYFLNPSIRYSGSYMELIEQ
jgi:hypothetical protein